MKEISESFGEIRNRIISLIQENRISTTEVADALGKSGHIKGLLPLIPRMHKVGQVEFIYAYNQSNWEMHDQLQSVSQNKIVYVHSIECGDRAIFGDLVCKYVVLYKKSIGLVVNGFLRDAHTLVKENYPIWCSGVSPIGCTNKKNTTLPEQELLAGLKSQFHGGIMVCDDSGVVLIRPDQITEELYTKLEFIEFQEDIWYFCLDTRKMNTFEIVCEKRYLTEEGLIDKDTLTRLAEFSNKLDKL